MDSHISRIRDFSKEFDFNDETVCRIHTSLIQIYGRNNWIKITSKNASIYRRVKGLSMQNFTKDSMELDYDSRLELGISGAKKDTGFIDCDVNIKKASLVEVFQANWNYPNYPVKIAFRLGILSVFLAVIGLIK